MEISVECPYCGEPLELSVDESGGEVQKYVEDCAVCCRPICLTVTCEPGELSDVQAERG